MTQNEYIDKIGKVYAKNLEISRKKSSDYATEDQPFKNFEASLLLGVPLEKAILVRITDKLMRCANLLDKPPAVAEESILDTLEDICNYSAILHVYIEEKNETQV